MPRFATALFIATLASGACLAQQQSPQNNPQSQNSQDVPQQSPGTQSPDVNKQRTPTPKPNGQTQPADVPHQQPGTNNPDVSKQRKEAPRKKHGKNTGSSSSSTS